MTGDDQGPERPFSTIPNRPPLRTVVVDTLSKSMEAEMEAMGRERAAQRTAARVDAANAVARARERAGLPAIWSAIDADVLHAITELLQRVQDQPPAPGPGQAPQTRA